MILMSFLAAHSIELGLSTTCHSIDVTGGEQDCDLRIWNDMVKNKIVNIFQPDVMYLGGLTRTLQVAKIIEEGGYICTPHAANLSLVTMCTMHLLKAIPNAGPYLELSIEGEDYYPWQQDLFLNDYNSPIANQSNYFFNMFAGEEKSVAATDRKSVV